MNAWRVLMVTGVGMGVLLGGCRKSETPPSTAGKEETPAPTNRVDVPAAVRQNLGITFAKVERRGVTQSVRAPGRFELEPDARREYRTMLAGQVEPTVTQFASVKKGDVVFRLRSPRWRELQQAIAEAESAIRTAQAVRATFAPLRESHKVHEESLAELVEVWRLRLEQLEKVKEAGGGRASEIVEARATLAGVRSQLGEVMEKDAELEAKEREVGAQLEAGTARRELLLSSAATLLGMSPEELGAPTSDDPNGQPRWRKVDEVEVRAAMDGVVESLAVTAGAWVEESSLVITTVQPERVRFRARGLQSDLGWFRDGLKAKVTPAAASGGGAVRLQDDMEGDLKVGLAADADERTVELYVTPRELKGWARAGVSAYLEVSVAGGASQELAVPLSAVARDGLVALLFRRDPKDPDKVIRMEADLGLNDGRWVVVKSGLMEGDEVVLDGVYQLMLATSGTAARGGHFHSDGTFHEGEH